MSDIRVDIGNQRGSMFSSGRKRADDDEDINQCNVVVLLIVTIAIDSASPEEIKCHQITIDGVNYVQETLKDGIDKPYNLAIDKEKDIVYFSYGVDIENDEFNSAYINLKTKEFDTVPGVNNGFTQTVDDKTHEVYVGGSDGIYKFKHGDKTAELIAEKGTNIWHVYFNKVLYYSTFPMQFFYTYDGEVMKFIDLEDTKVDQFVIDDDDNVIYYTNADGLYQKVKNEDAVMIQEFPDDDPRCLTNNNGILYVCIKDGVYSVNKETNSIDKLFNVTDLYGLAMDSDNNIIYSDISNVYRLNKDRAC